MKYWLISFLSLTTLIFMLSCTDSLTGNDDDNNNNNDSTQNDSTKDTTDTNVVDTSDTVPTAPTNVSATKGSSSVYIYVTWTPVLGEGVTRYKIINSTNPDALNDKSEYSKIYEADTSDSAFMTGYYVDSIEYKSDQKYYYRVIAINYYGESEWSDLDSGWLYWIDPNDTIPQQFDDYVTSTSDANDNIKIVWYSKDTSDVFNIYKSEGDTNNWTLIAADADTPFVDTADLLPGTTYYYALTKIPQGGVESLKSSPLTLTTKSLGPDSVWISDVTSNSVTVNWTSVEGAFNYGVYVIRDSINSIADKYVSDTTVTLTALESGSEISIVVNGNISGLLTYFSDTAVAKTLYQGPGNVSATNNQENFILISWNKLSVGTDSIDGAVYSLYKGTDTSSMILVDSTLTLTSYIDSNVIADTIYHYKVKAVDTTGHASIFSFITSGKSIETITFVAPDTLWKESGIDTGIVLHWNDAFGAASYKLYRKSSYDTNDDWHLIASPTDTTYHDSTTVDRLGYAYAVSTVSDSNEESTKYTNNRTFASLGGDYSHIDINLAADTTTPGQITVSWNKTTNGTEENYIIYRQQNSELMTIVEAVDSSVTSWIDTSVTSGDIMEYVVDPIFDIGGVKYKVGIISTGLYNNSVTVTMP